MQLTPKQPPGRKSRKARAFGEEIHRLQVEGYTCETIREALAEAGVHVSRSTVAREAARFSMRHAPTSLPGPGTSPTPTRSGVATPVQQVRQPAGTPFAGDSRSGKEIAEAFISSRISNPFIRERHEDESRRD